MWSNRGDIIVRKSSGNINVAGNYGALNVQNVHGETAVSTIMGNVMFDGLIQMGDIVRLETDHGPVSVNLNQDSDLGHSSAFHEWGCGLYATGYYFNYPNLRWGDWFR